MATVIDDQQVRALLSNPKARQLFPFMNTAYLQIQNGVKSGCGTCGKKKVNNKSHYENVKKAIGLMPNSQKQQLKKLLGAQQIEVTFTHNKRTRTLRFS